MFAASKSGRAAAAAATDANFRYVPLLLETTSTNGQQNNTFLDSSTNNFTITRNGTPTQGSRTPYWPNGQWSNYFNGSSQLSLSNNADFEIGAGNFSYEAFVYATVATNTFAQGIVSYGIAGSTGSSTCDMAISAAGFFQLAYATGAAATLTDSTAFPLNQWVHCVVCRSGSTISMFVNGVRRATATTSATVGTGGIMTIGSQWYANASTRQLQNGYISNARVLKGASAYDATLTTLTVPTAPLSPSTANQVLLTCYSNRFIDANTATTAKTITPAGTPSVQAFQPFSPAASYSAATYAGSGYFNGSTDYLTTTANAAFTFGTSDLTLECWIYQTATSTSAYKVIFTDNVYAAAGGYALYSYNNALNLWRGGAEIIAPAGTINLNAWTHVAWTRSGSSNRLFINGTQVGATTTNANSYTGTITYIGASSVPTLFFPGYISNARIVKGTAVYTADFTPPTTPVTNITNTSLLLNMANAGIYDAAAQNDMTTVGDAQASTTQSKWSPTSMKFDGTGDWLTAIDGPQLQLGTGDFTIDGWVYLSATGVAYGIISKGAAATGWSVNVTSGNKLQFSYTASNLTGATSLAATTWYYFAVVRSGSATGNLKVYLNGSVDATSGGAVTDNFNQTDILYVGASRTGATPLNGYLQDVRITKAARTITTPTAAFPTR